MSSFSPLANNGRFPPRRSQNPQNSDHQTCCPVADDPSAADSGANTPQYALYPSSPCQKRASSPTNRSGSSRALARYGPDGAHPSWRSDRRAARLTSPSSSDSASRRAPSACLSPSAPIPSAVARPAFGPSSLSTLSSAYMTSRRASSPSLVPSSTSPIAAVARTPGSSSASASSRAVSRQAFLLIPVASAPPHPTPQHNERPLTVNGVSDIPIPPEGVFLYAYFPKRLFCHYPPHQNSV